MYIGGTSIMLVLIIVVLYFLERSSREGWFVRGELGIYHTAIKNILDPYKKTTFAKELIADHAHRCNEQAKYIRKGNPSQNALVLCENRDDSKFVKTYAMLMILRRCSTRDLFEEEPLRLLKGSLAEKLIQQEEIHPFFYDYFSISPDSMEKYLQSKKEELLKRSW